MATIPDVIKKDLSILDVHTHVGVDPKLYLSHSLPYCRSIDVAYREAVEVGIGATVCFPFITSLYYDLKILADTGDVEITGNGIGRAPYHFENEHMLRQLYELFPEYADHFIPFVIVDTLRETEEQVRVLDDLLSTFPFYGIKIHPRDAQAHVATLSKEGQPILDFAQAYDFPILIHACSTHIDPLSSIRDIFCLARRYPSLRWCAAHFCGFHQELFDEADRIDNLWVDSAAMSIGCDSVLEGYDVYENGPEKIAGDYNKPEEIFFSMAERYPDTFMFGTDNPAHSWIAVTKFSSGKVERFEMKSTMEREISLLSLVKGEHLEKIACRNALRFIEG